MADPLPKRSSFEMERVARHDVHKSKTVYMESQDEPLVCTQCCDPMANVLGQCCRAPRESNCSVRNHRLGKGHTHATETCSVHRHLVSLARARAGAASPTGRTLPFIPIGAWARFAGGIVGHLESSSASHLKGESLAHAGRGPSHPRLDGACLCTLAARSTRSERCHCRSAFATSRWGQAVLPALRPTPRGGADIALTVSAQRKIVSATSCDTRRCQNAFAIATFGSACRWSTRAQLRRSSRQNGGRTPTARTSPSIN